MSRGSTEPVHTGPSSTKRVATETAPVELHAARAKVRPATNQGRIGRLVSIHRGLPLQWSELLLVFLPASLVVIAPLGYGLWRAWYAYTNFGPAAASAWARPWYIFATVALVPFSLLAIYRMYLASRYVAVHEEGLRLRLSPFSNLRLTWDEITGIATAAYQDHFLGLALRLRPQITIYRRSGRPIRLDGRLQKITSLTRRLKSNLYPRLWPEISARLKAGNPVQFGPLSVHPKVLYLKHQSIPWEQVSRLSVRSGFLVVELEAGKPVRIPVAHIPNLELLLQLVDWGINP
jgi:hypothetical protein